MKYRVVEKQYNTDRCFVCGTDNPAGTVAEFYVVEKQDERGSHEELVLLTCVTPKDIHQSYPNRMHGGVISALLDESIGRSAQILDPNVWAVTVELNVKFKKPVPLGRPIYIESRVNNVNRIFEGQARMFMRDASNTLVDLATATGKFFRLPYDTVFAGAPLTDETWFKYGDTPDVIEV